MIDVQVDLAPVIAALGSIPPRVMAGLAVVVRDGLQRHRASVAKNNTFSKWDTGRKFIFARTMHYSALIERAGGYKVAGKVFGLGAGSARGTWVQDLDPADAEALLYAMATGSMIRTSKPMLIPITNGRRAARGLEELIRTRGGFFISKYGRGGGGRGSGVLFDAKGASSRSDGLFKGFVARGRGARLRMAKPVAVLKRSRKQRRIMPWFERWPASEAAIAARSELLLDLVIAGGGDTKFLGNAKRQLEMSFGRFQRQTRGTPGASGGRGISRQVEQWAELMKQYKPGYSLADREKNIGDRLGKRASGGSAT